MQSRLPTVPTYEPVTNVEMNDWNVSWSNKTPFKVKSWWTTRSSSSGKNMPTKSQLSTSREKTLRRHYDEDETTEDAKKRRRLREHNRIAAAKYRQRFVDHTIILKNESDMLEQEHYDLQNKINSLKKRKEHLERLMMRNRPLCNIKNKPNFVNVESATACSNTHFMVELPEMSVVGDSHLPSTEVSDKLEHRENSLLPYPVETREHTMGTTFTS